MRIRLAYGRSGLSVDFPADRTTVIEPTYVPGLPDQAGAIMAAIRNPIGTAPLRRLVRKGQRVAISVCDVTRPMPSATVLPVLMRDLAHIPDQDITILVASGTHRPTTAQELNQVLGSEIVERYEVVNHDAFDARGLVNT
ncbi:MAG: DUF2088 domain-containing protein, partial [Chloroflexi bacterium]|nr:DUF2088 domain-containing protein [Chloroflexota bacterium]